MRSAEFDREKVLRAAIKAFVCKGYNKTSMQDLKKATGLHPGSIYCAFENKQGLLVAAIEQYSQDRAAEFEQYFTGNQTILAGLKKYLEGIANECIVGGHQKVCLSLKALSELSEQAPEVENVIGQNLIDWQKGFIEMFEQAQAAGEISDKRSPTQRTQSLIVSIYGLRTYAQTHPSNETLAELAQQIFDDVCR
ncbi:TetR/AcrR family transcriptional regulator [Psychrobium sp. 1_MG-2023]|uniref:TetR/AcrR family transcriptional regulator n=1 Tax=Psychrobium sp. 1_MG-2023 TaxID=3062624 RepID=UPI000C31F202|nr:TetR/AcrR family transcriptional regulator [Psychrobium sp. 1_MG-2023]MDP2562816.1 TetR/AcrR family transcriptional regulator [Psychrobium sp. 1_MG-2023]PKF54435.1 TetR family transcriptional regulator [Alteromonadales bacterium alter-6D02]